MRVSRWLAFRTTGLRRFACVLLALAALMLAARVESAHQHKGDPSSKTDCAVCVIAKTPTASSGGSAPLIVWSRPSHAPQERERSRLDRFVAREHDARGPPAV